MDDYSETLPLLVNAKFTLNIQSDGKVSLTIRTDDEEELERLIQTWETRIVVYPENTNGKQNGHAKLGDKCPECNSPLVKRQSRNGTFLGCMSYPACSYTSSLK